MKHAVDAERAAGLVGGVHPHQSEIARCSGAGAACSTYGQSAARREVPQYYDGTFFAGEFGRRWIKNIVMDATGAPLAINPFPWSGTQVMDMEFGPDGAL